MPGDITGGPAPGGYTPDRAIVAFDALLDHLLKTFRDPSAHDAYRAIIWELANEPVWGAIRAVDGLLNARMTAVAFHFHGFAQAGIAGLHLRDYNHERPGVAGMLLSDLQGLMPAIVRNAPAALVEGFLAGIVECAAEAMDAGILPSDPKEAGLVRSSLYAASSIVELLSQSRAESEKSGPAEETELQET